MRNLLEQVRIPPQVGKYKVYIIDEVHMLSASAFNAFLKTLEEPPPYAIFILATTAKHKILPTILSRCQVFNFNRIEVRDIVDHLREIAQKERVSAEEDVLHLIARKADGGLRDALSIFDQLVSYSDGGLTYSKAVEILNELDADTYFEITDAVLKGDAGFCILALDRIIRRGFEGSVFIAGLTAHFRNLAVCKDVRTAALLDMSDNFRQKYAEQASAMGFSLVLNGLNLLNECDEKYKISRHPRLLVELTLMKLANLKSFISHLATLEELKKKALNP